MNLPQKFKDDAGREWSMLITWGTCKRVKLLACVDIDDLVRRPKVNGKDSEKISLDPLKDLLCDPYKMLEVCYAILKPDADKLGLSHDEFDDGFAGSLIAMRGAFWEAFVDFSEPLELKKILRGAMRGAMRMETTAKAKLTPASLDAAIEMGMEKAISEFQASLSESTAPPASLESPIPTTSTAGSLANLS